MPMTSTRILDVVDLGRTGYAEAWDLQRALHRARTAGTIPDTLLLTEHRHVYTIGTTGSDLHLLAGRDELAEKGVEVIETDRGGDITYHGPGQLVGYPIIDLRGHTLDLHRYLRDVEEAVIRALRPFGIAGARLQGYTGVWVGGEKICALGIRVSRWTTMHGFALNVSTDLSMFDRIIPCGIFERGVTSMQSLKGTEEVSMECVKASVVASFAEVFGVQPRSKARGTEVPQSDAMKLA